MLISFFFFFFFLLLFLSLSGARAPGLRRAAGVEQAHGATREGQAVSDNNKSNASKRLQLKPTIYTYK